MPDKRILIFLLAVFCCVATLQLLGGSFPNGINWGFHFLGFFPWYVVVMYLIGSGILIVLLVQSNIDRFVGYCSQLMERKPYKLLLTVLFSFVVFAFLFRVKASLLGDSLTVIKSYLDYEQGLTQFEPWNEPFSMFFFYYGIKLFSQLTFPDVFWSFFALEIFLGMAFITIMFYAVRELFTDSAQQVLSFALILVFPYMEFFFGYIETYAFSLVVLALFFLLSLYVLHDKLPFWVIPLSYVIVTFSHYLNGALGVSVLYLAYQEYKKKRISSLFIGFSSAVILVVLIFASVKFDITRLVDFSPLSHQLSFGENISLFNKYSQAYTLFSWIHLADLLNYAIMMAPLTIAVLVAWALHYRKQIVLGNRLTIWFLTALLPIAVYLFLAKLELGFADDWDVFARFFVLLNLFTAYLFFSFRPAQSVKLFSIVIVASAVLSLPWFLLNATTSPAVQRFKTLTDDRNVSHLGQYTKALKLFRYYDITHDTAGSCEVWRQYRSHFPSDPRGYANEMESLNLYAPARYEQKIALYEEWLRLTSSSDIRHAYASECYNAGTYYYHLNNFDSALTFFSKSIQVDSTQSQAYNNIGCIFAKGENHSKPVEFFKKAIRFDSLNSDAYYNLGTIYEDSGMKELGIHYIRHAAKLGNSTARKVLEGGE